MKNENNFNTENKYCYLLKNFDCLIYFFYIINLVNYFERL